MHRKHIRATDAGTGTDVDVPTAIWADGQFLIYLGGELFTQFVVQSHNTSTDNAVARWDGTTGHLIQDSTVIIDDAGAVTGVTTMNGVPPGDWVRGPTPAVSTDNAVARWDGTSGRLIQNSVVVINDTGDITGVTSINTIPVGDFVRGPTPATATNNHVALWDGTSGRLIKDSPVTIDPTTGDITTPGDMTPATINAVPVGVLVKSSSPTPHTDNAVARWDGAAGHPLQDSTVIINDTGDVTGVTTLNGVEPNVWVRNYFLSSTVNNIVVYLDNSGTQVYDPNISITTLVRQNTGSNTDNAVVRWDGSGGGRLVQNSTVIIDDSGNVTGVTTINGVDPSTWVQGPASAGNNRLASYNGTSGKLIQDSGIPSIQVVRMLSTSTDNAVVRWDGTTGIPVQNSVVIIDDSGNITGAGTLNTRTISRWVDGPASGGSTDNTLAVWDGTSGRLLKDGSTTAIAVDPSTGIITTPVGVLVHSGTTHTDNAIVRWDGTGAHQQDSTVLLSDTGAMSGVFTIQGTTGTAKGINLLPTVSSATANNLASFSSATAGSYGIGDSGVIATAVVTATAAFGTDNRLLRSDGTGRASQASVITIDDSGNMTGVGTINGSAAIGETHIGVGSAPNATVTTNLQYIGSFTPLPAGDWGMMLWIPIILSGTSGTIGVTCSWGSGTGSAGFSIGNAGGATQTSGTNMAVNKTALGTLGGLLCVSVNVVGMTAGTGITIEATNTGSTYHVYPGIQITAKDS